MLWKHVLCRALAFVIGALALGCAVYMLAGCSAASFDVAEAKQGETAGEDAGGGADSGAPGEDSAPQEVGADTGIDGGGNDGGCTLYAHHGPVAGTMQDWHSCTPAGVPGDASTYSRALTDEQVAHAKATSVHGWTWSDPVDILCNGDSPVPAASGEACETTTLTTTSGPVIVTWCWGGSLAGTSIESDAGKQCPTFPADATWW